MRNHRRLSIETLETRKMLACDAFASVAHEFQDALADTNRDGIVAPSDALMVINQINSGETQASDCERTDVNLDGAVSPLDALMVINRISDLPVGLPEAAADFNHTLITERITGMTEDQATEIADFFGYRTRVVERDGERFFVTADYRLDRLTFSINDGVVVSARVG